MSQQDELQGRSVPTPADAAKAAAGESVAPAAPAPEPAEPEAADAAAEPEATYVVVEDADAAAEPAPEQVEDADAATEPEAEDADTVAEPEAEDADAQPEAAAEGTAAAAAAGAAEGEQPSAAPAGEERLTEEEIEAARAGIERIVDNVCTVILGKREAVELVTLALVAKGHVLLEDLPGTGKTTLVSTLARSIDCDFKRIQFTPDVMPSDVSGFSIFNQKTREFEFRPGGVMSNLVLADEINRASAKTQSALLEAMEERQVTVDAQTYKLEEPFMVLATQNPIEQFGTYPLPEAQVDRFLIKLSMGYPDFQQEVAVLRLGNKAKNALSPVVSGADVLALREAAEKVYIADLVLNYIVEIVNGTRTSPEVKIGSSPRGGIALVALTRAYALLQGRGYVLPDDVKFMAPYVLCHRISLAHEAKVQGRTPQQVIASILAGISVPYYDEAMITGAK